MTSGQCDLDSVKYINLETHENLLKRSQVDQDDLLIKITGVGRMAVASVPPKGFKGNINQHIVRIKTESREISTYLAAYLNTDIGEQLASRRSTGGTRPALDYEALKSIPIVFSPEILHIIEKAEQTKKQKETEAQRLLDSIDKYVLSELGIELPEFEHKMCFSVRASEVEKDRLDVGFHDPKAKQIKLENSKYELKKLSEIFEINRGGSPRPIRKFLTEDQNGINWIKIGDTKGVQKFISTTKEKIIKEGVKYSRMVEPGDFILSNSMSFGRPYIMDTTGCIHDGWLVFKEKQQINKDFMFSLLRSKLMYTLFERLTLGGVVQNLNIELIKTVLIPLPPLDIQEKIANEVQTRIDKLEVLKQQAKETLEAAKAQVEKIILGKEI